MAVTKVSKSEEFVGDSDSGLDSDEEFGFHPPAHYDQVKDFKSINPSHLKDKQIWLIKTPKNFSFKNIK